MNNIIEQDHRFIKKRIVASLWFRSVEGALNTIDGYEAMNMVRKGQVRWLANDDFVGQVKFIESLFGIAAWLLLELHQPFVSNFTVCDTTELSTLPC
jgi:hypothetical protein